MGAEAMIEGAPEGQGEPARAARRPRIAVAHDWLCGYRGGEAVLERIAAVVEAGFEAAGLYVMFDDGRWLSPTVDRWRSRGLIRASSLNRLPGSGSLRRWMLPLYPRAVAGLGRALGAEHARTPIDLLISSSSAAVKGLRAPQGVPHLCYCHSPARYVWSRRADYGGRSPLAKLRAAGLRAYGERFRRWDRETAAGVTRFLANSTHTGGQVRACYGAEAGVVFPPVRTEFFTPDPGVARQDFWLMVSALEPYKRVDLAIEAAARAGKRLVVAGSGSQERVLRRMAAGPVEFRGRVSDGALRDLYRRASVLIFPQVEDFGIVAAEALACGLPVAARGEGGAVDILEDGVTGALFAGATPEALAGAARRAAECDPVACRAGAERFAEARFDDEMRREIRAVLGIARGARPSVLAENRTSPGVGTRGGDTPAH